MSDQTFTVVQPDGLKVVKIEGYLTESKLSKALQQLLPDYWLGDQVRVATSRQRWDMSYQLDGIITVVEYDGDEHYRHSIKIKGDWTKDEIARAQGCRVVRFPYWIQLDNLTLKHYFGLQAQVDQSFPHGFITSKLSRPHFVNLVSSGFGLNCLLYQSAFEKRSSHLCGSV